MYDPVAEFPELFPEEKPTGLAPLRKPLEIMRHRIDVTTNWVWIPRFPSTYNQFEDQISKKITTELETGIIVSSKSRNSIGMFTKPKRDKLQEARFRPDWIPRNLVTHIDETPVPSMEQIKDFIGSRAFTSKLDLTHGYHNIWFHADSVSDSTFTCHMGKFASLGMQQGDCNGPATMMRAIVRGCVIKWACQQLPICRAYWKTACRSSYLPVLLPLVTKTMSQL